MKKMTVLGAAIAATLALTSAAQAVVTFNISPLSSFGTTGWVKPGDNANLGTGNNARGLAYNPVTGQVYVASTQAGNAVAVFNGQTGAFESSLSMTGVTGGTRAVSMIGIADDGVIYMCNLQGAQGAAAPWKVYRWANNAAAPTVAFSGNTLSGSRIGDTLDVIGSGANTKLVGGYNNAPAIAGNNSYAILSTADGVTYTSNHISIAGSPPAAGDFRLGITFLGDANKVLGTQGGGTANHGRLTTVSGTTATLDGTINLATGSGRLMDYIEFWGAKLLAVTDTTTSATRIFDMTNPLAPVQLTAGGVTATGFTHTTNGNGTGQVKWGAVDGGTAKLYVMNTNNGIQAFTVAIPEPSALGLLAVAVPALARRRRA